jgi:Annexin
LIKKALKSGDKKGIVKILCRRSLSQRLEIAAAYKTDVKKNLIDEIKLKISGSVKNVFVGLLTSIPEFYCRQLRKMKNDGALENVTIAVLTMNLSTDFFDGDDGEDSVLIEIMCTMSNSEIRKICATYQQLFGKRLEQGIRESKTGNFRKLLKILSAGNRDESTAVDVAAAKSDAEELKKNLAKYSVDEKQLVEVFSVRSFAHIKVVSDEYKKLTGTSLAKSVKKKVSDSLRKAFLAIIRTAINSIEFFARRISKAINNHMIDDRSLGRLVIVRSEIDLLDIKEEFNRIFRKPLKSCLKGDIKGTYKLALLTLLGET